MASSERAPSPPSSPPSSSSSSTRVISADSVEGVRRWTIGGFDATGHTRPPEPRVRAEHLPTVDEVADIERQARDEGYRAGLAEARDGNARIARWRSRCSSSRSTSRARSCARASPSSPTC
jgi:hypothetical protein